MNMIKTGIQQSIIKSSFNNSSKFGIRAFCTHYSEELEWVKLSDDNKVATVGLSHFGAKRLGKISYVGLPKEHRKLRSEEKFGVLESSNATAFGLYAPVSGEVLEVNEKLEKTPSLLSSDPENNWMVKFKVSKPDEFKKLMDSKQYKKFVKWYR
ncbi:hypothetical protein ACTA71_000182 [Dictyostelium dimigraforme]